MSNKDQTSRRIRKRTTKTVRGKKEYTIYSISIPEEIASRIPNDMLFKVELTEDGILLKPVMPAPPQPPPAPVLPTWLAAKPI